MTSHDFYITFKYIFFSFKYVLSICRSSPQKCFLKKVVLNVVCNVIKKRHQRRCLPVNIAKVLKKTYSEERLQTAASVYKVHLKNLVAFRMNETFLSRLLRSVLISSCL